MFNKELYSKSVYRRDYKGARGERRSPAVFESDYSDPAAGPFLHCLLPESQKHNLPRATKFQHHNDAIKWVIEQNPAMRSRLTDGPINMDVIKQIYLDLYRTEYNVKYCGLAKTLADTYQLPRMPNGRVNVKLPDGWPEPSSTYRDSYRGPVFGPNPIILPPNKPIVLPIDNLQPSRNATTGNSEYQVVHGKLGEQILTEHYHGQIHRKILEKD